MSDKESSENHGNDEQEEIFVNGCVTYVGALRARNGRLQSARDTFMDQVDWLNGYLFIVNEFVSEEDGIPAETARTYMEALQHVIDDLRDELEDVEQIAGELYAELVRPGKSAGEAQPPGGQAEAVSGSD